MRRLSPSLEDYLEAIGALIRESEVARVRDIARRLGVGMPAVTSALRTLSDRELVHYEPYQYITLTARGREAAEEISRRHSLLRDFLTDVFGLDEKTAEANACRMEHAIDAEVMEKFRRFTRFVQQCPRAGADWVEAFRTRGERNPDSAQCRQCLDKAVRKFEAGGPSASSDPQRSVEKTTCRIPPPRITRTPPPRPAARPCRWRWLRKGKLSAWQACTADGRSSIGWPKWA